MQVFSPRNWECFVYLCTPFCPECISYFYTFLSSMCDKSLVPPAEATVFCAFFAILKMAEVGERI